MKWNRQFNYPKSTKSFVSGSRLYDVNQEKLPSVTAILSATASEEKKAALKAWKEKVGHQEAEKIKTPKKRETKNNGQVLKKKYKTPFK